MKMAKSHYLPFEELKKYNFPEVFQIKPKIDAIISYASEVDVAVLNYNNGKTDRIDLNPVEIKRTIATCREVCEVLGNASNVCYDILLEIRSIQTTLQELIFISRRFGNEYIGTPTKKDDFGNGGIG